MYKKTIIMASAVAAILTVTVLTTAMVDQAFAKNVAIGGDGGQGGAGGAGGNGGAGGENNAQHNYKTGVHQSANGGNANGGDGGNANGGNACNFKCRA
jgi:hypothetical protein